MRSGWLAAGLGVSLLTCIVLARVTMPAELYGGLTEATVYRYIGLSLAAGAIYLGAVVVLKRRTVPRWTIWAGLAAGLGARLVLVATPPLTSTDLYRYVWDGRVQAHGINPYRYIPADPALLFLRDGGSGPVAIFSNMNRADTARTIYPPGAQLLFALIGQIGQSIWTVKATMLVMDLIVGAASWGLLLAAGRPASWILIWAWNPLAIMEFSGGGHIDAAALAASSVALLLAARRRPGAAGAALGLAVLFKLLPAALFPAIWRKRSLRAPAAALAVIAAGYAIYASAGLLVFGYVGGYAQEEGLGGGGFLLLRLFALAGPLPKWAGPLYLLASLLLLGGLAARISLRDRAPRADVIARDALMLSAALLVTLSPHYPWYLTMLVAPSVVAPRLGALWPTALAPLMVWDGGVLGAPWWSTIVLGPVAIWLLFELSGRIEHA